MQLQQGLRLLDSGPRRTGGIRIRWQRQPQLHTWAGATIGDTWAPWRTSVACLEMESKLSVSACMAGEIRMPQWPACSRGSVGHELWTVLAIGSL